MSQGNNPRDEAELTSFLARESALSAAYDAIEPVEPPEVLDAKILNHARGALSPAAARAPDTPAAAKPAAARPVAGEPSRPAAPKPVVAPPPAVTTRAPARPAVPDDTDDDDDAPAAGRRPRWLVPAAAAASLLVAVGVGFAVLGTGGDRDDAGADAGQGNPLGALFARRARERSEAEQAAAADAGAGAEAEVVELEPLPPPPVFEAEGPQIEDLDTAIALIRRELVLANNQVAAETVASEAAAEDAARQALAPAAAPAQPAGSAADTASTTSPAPGVIQPRERRLAKILELYDGGNPDLAAASLEIFLRDFEDDPVSQRILEAQPKPTDVAVE
jgi:hypothetical protein